MATLVIEGRASAYRPPSSFCCSTALGAQRCRRWRPAVQTANSVLALASPGNPSGDANAAYEQALAQALQAANGNTDFVSQELLWGLIALYPGLA
jgi:hypothetical protein